MSEKVLDSLEQLAQTAFRIQKERNALLEACRSLMNEVKANCGAFEEEMRLAIGNSNFNCLEHRIAQAREAIKLAEEGQ